ncbi:GrpB-like predicted nucleotidyltransferase (UPF0157 family) [Leucobacter exalbidus]|uniref:GrpB-like predicted nucleotidyltransferase (UPF0157 family) n=1 Tax=Leucobacter exalbidus TaxID=662960 RepID=A0A940PRF0_9MICO|nr:GrpB-like predicted nucleotidyltransferase (UPF0157 family) [Leucobacter exalbidus]
MTVEWFGEPGGEPVELSAADAAWAVTAAEWAARMHDALAPTQVTVEHVGSTSVAGMPAKPVLDLVVGVPDIADEAAYRPCLESLGLMLRQREPDHRFFRPPAGAPRSVHVHVCQHGSNRERDYLRFRDRLRADPALAAQYAALKLALSQQVGEDRAAYNAGKTSFIASVIAD